MPTIINIGGDSADVHYRYKRDQIETQFLNTKGGITSITNFDIILKQLKMPQEFAVAFYKKVKKTYGLAQLNPGQFRGVLTINQLEKILNKMIKKYVLCVNCGLPEITKGICLACGYSGSSSTEHPGIGGREQTPAQSVQTIKDIITITAMQSYENNINPSLKLVHHLYDLYRVNETDGLNKALDDFWKIHTDNKEAENDWYNKYQKYLD